MTKNPIRLGPEFQVNTHPIDFLSHPSITSITGGGYVVTWQTRDLDGDAYGIFGQRFDGAGNPLGGEFQVNTYTAGNQAQSSITSLADGGFVVTWSSAEQDGDSFGVFGQRFGAAGAAVGAEFQVNTTTAGNQGGSSTTSLANGGFVVTWTAYSPKGGNSEVFGQLFDATGAAVGGEFRINTYTPHYQRATDITALADGGFVVTWQSSGIFGQRYDVAGAAVGTEFQINTFTGFQHESPSITALSDGGFVVTWQSENQDSSHLSVYGQRFNETGARVGSEFLIKSLADSGQFLPDITALADGGFVVVWESSSREGYGFGDGVYGQRYDASGTVVGAEFEVFTADFASYERVPVVTSLSDGGFVVSWSAHLGGGNHGVLAQQYAAQLFGTAAGETVTDTVGANWLNGQGGNDILRGLLGDDKLIGETGGDMLFGGKGHDILKGGKGSDVLFGGRGRDTLVGGNGVDDLHGGKGNDVLDGGAKNDKLSGGSGKDEFVFMDGSGKDRIADFEDDIDTFKLDQDLWGGGMTKQQVVNMYASVDGSDIVFDFGTDELRLKGFTDLTELKDDMAFI